MKKISITKVRRELSALHVRYMDYCQVYTINDYTVKVCIEYSPRLKDDIMTVINYLKANYKVEVHVDGTYIITQKNEY